MTKSAGFTWALTTTLSKPFHLAELSARVSAVIRRKYVSRAITDFVCQEMDLTGFKWKRMAPKFGLANKKKGALNQYYY